MSTRTERLKSRLSINPDETTAPVRAVPTPAPEAIEAEEVIDLAAPSEPAEATTVEAAPKPTRTRKSQAQAAAEAPLEGRSDYRSFYVSDAAYMRFRAAIYWASRNPKAIGEVPQSMSAAAEEWMLHTAEDLEQRFNDGDVYPTPPATRRRRKAE